MPALDDLQRLPDDQLIEKVGRDVLGWRGMAECWKSFARTGRRKRWNPLLCWDDTMDIVKAMHRRYGFVQFSWFDQYGFSLAHSIHPGGNVRNHSNHNRNDPQRAICLAALLALSPSRS